MPLILLERSTTMAASAAHKLSTCAHAAAYTSQSSMRVLILLIALCALAEAQDESCKANVATNSGPPSTSKWNWDPRSTSHQCNIHRISQSELLHMHGKLGLPNLYPYPLVIYPDDAEHESTDDKNGTKPRSNRNGFFANLTTVDNLPKQFTPNFNVTLTGSDSLSSHRRVIPLSQYLLETYNARETLPDQLGNETWYLFGETFTSEWQKFLQNYDLPTCHSCTALHREQNLVALSFGVGNIGSGVQWHLHGPGFSETIHGRKHWVLYPPEFRPDYDLNYASRHWMEYTYPNLKDWSAADVEFEKMMHMKYKQRPRAVTKEKTRQESGPSNRKPWECTIHEGEMIYFPDGWHHATINLDRYTVFVSSFTSEHDSL